MNRLHARYPFTEAAQRAVETEGIDLVEVVAAEGFPGDRAVDRAIERVERAIREGRTGDAELTRRPTVELLSYPVARVLVSLVDSPELTDAYVRAEARTARERFGVDVGESPARRTRGRSGRGTRRDVADRADRAAAFDLSGLLEEFDLGEAVRPVPADGAGTDAGPATGAVPGTGTDVRSGTGAGGSTDVDGGAADRATRFAVDVAAYLDLAGGLDGAEWRLVARELADGTVPVDREELFDLLEVAVEDRIAEGLPLQVPDAVAAPLDDAVARVESVLGDLDLPRVGRIVPDAFPPCVRALLDRVRDGEDLPDHSWFALVAFLTDAGADAGDVLGLCGLDDPGAGDGADGDAGNGDGAPGDAEGDDTPGGAGGDDRVRAVRRRVGRLAADDGGDYPPPSCATMQAYGDCVNRDDLCERIDHPVEYYGRRVGADGDGDGEGED